MPLVQPNNLREKILLIAPGKAGKTTCWLSIAFWALKSGDSRAFYVITTDDEAVEAVMLDEKYRGMSAEEGGNVHLFPVRQWEDYQEASEKVLASAQQGDWIVIDFITHAWTEVANYYLREVRKKERAEVMLDASKKGAQGWDLFREIDYQVVNPLYDAFFKPLLLQSRAHLFLVAEQDEIYESGKNTEDQKAHLREWGKYKAKGQKALPFQCRSYLRLQRLARGRVLFTLGDRAREELNGKEMAPDFYKTFLEGVAGWKVESPEDA